MVRPGRRAVLAAGALLAATAGACLCTALASAAAGARQAAARPLVVIFGAPAPAAPTAPFSADFARQAARAVRDRLADGGIVDVLVYTPDAPTFVRAVQENKIALGPKGLTPDAQIALAKAVGAAYVLSVQSRRTSAGGVAIDAQALATASPRNKPWEFRTEMRATGGNPAAVSVPFGNDLLSAANTLAQRFLTSPLLGEYTRSTVPGTLLPPPGRASAAAPPGDENGPGASGDPAVSIDARARATRQQGDALLAAGDTDGAITALRRAVNLAPRDAQTRATLIRAYLAARRGGEAAAEAKRGITVTSSEDRAGRLELLRLLAEALALNGDATAARIAFEQIIAAQPRAAWAYLALGDLLLKENKEAQAEAAFRAAHGIEPSGRDAAERLVRLLVARGDFAGALRALNGVSSGDPVLRHSISRDLFEPAARTLVANLSANHKAWQAGSLSREAFYRATTTHTNRASGLLDLLKSGGLPTGSGDLLKAHKQRVAAASLLFQAASGLLSFLETGDIGAGRWAGVLLGEAEKELGAARATEAGRSALAAAAGGEEKKAAP